MWYLYIITINLKVYLYVILMCSHNYSYCLVEFYQRAMQLQTAERWASSSWATPSSGVTIDCWTQSRNGSTQKTSCSGNEKENCCVHWAGESTAGEVSCKCNLS